MSLFLSIVLGGLVGGFVCSCLLGAGCVVLAVVQKKKQENALKNALGGFVND